MRKHNPYLLTLYLLGSLLMAACANSVDDLNQANTPELVATQVELPAEYAGKTNPFSGDSSAISEGKSIFQTNCAACHGENGKGDGPAATSLDPKPQDLVTIGPSMSDGYLFWRISDGGLQAPFQSAMPAWKTILNEEQTWHVVAYLRELSQ